MNATQDSFGELHFFKTHPKKMKTAKIILLHLGYWLVYAVLMMIGYVALRQAPAPANVGPGYENYIAKMVFGIGFSAGLIAFYGGYFLIFSKGVSQKKWVSTALLTIPMIFFAGFIGWVAAMQIHGWNAAIYDPLQVFLEINFAISISFGLPSIVMGVGMRGFIEWYFGIEKKAELERRNKEMELALLKSQINPHFLFNTISNIDVLIDKDPPKASAYLNKLSGIMRFMLYETHAAMIPLSKELDYIAQYIDLQKIRFAHPDQVQFSVTGNAGTQQIAPMLFIPFIENAFKFGESKKSQAAIHIQFQISLETITLDCSNNYQPTASTSADGGLGNELMARRLELLYPQRHTLETSAADGKYKVQLSIKTA